MRNVAIIQRVLPHYRLAFFERLHARLQREDVAITVYSGEAQAGTVPQSVKTNAPWQRSVHNTYVRLGSRHCVLQDLPQEVHTADLVIVEQALRMVSSTMLQLRCRLTGRKFAFWGHGRNFQSRERASAVEAIKRSLTGACDWWFAYTERSARMVASAGFPRERCTVVNNTIDTDELAAAVAAVTADVRREVRRALSLQGTSLGVYCGGMYPDKRLAFLLAALEEVHARQAGFEMVFIGDGPDAELVRAAAARCGWIRYLGPIFGAERAKYLATADLMLMPAAVGLGLIDSFVCESPLATTDSNTHGPEIEYLTHGVTGLVSHADELAYARMVAATLADPVALVALKAGCRRAAVEFSLDGMVDRFAAGILACLAPPQSAC